MRDRVEDIYRIHPTPTGRMIEGKLVPVHEAGDADIVVWFPLPPEADQRLWEGLAGQTVGPDEVIVRAVPLFARGLNYGDRVSVVASAEGPLVATAIIRPSNHYGFRVHLPIGGWTLDQVIRRFGELGCLIEGFTERLIGLSCEPPIAQTVADELASLEADGRLTYETTR